MAGDLQIRQLHHMGEHHAARGGDQRIVGTGACRHQRDDHIVGFTLFGVSASFGPNGQGIDAHAGYEP